MHVYHRQSYSGGKSSSSGVQKQGNIGPLSPQEEAPGKPGQLLKGVSLRSQKPARNYQAHERAGGPSGGFDRADAKE
jgi:hypothetical protein